MLRAVAVGEAEHQLEHLDRLFAKVLALAASRHDLSEYLVGPRVLIGLPDEGPEQQVQLGIFRWGSLPFRGGRLLAPVIVRRRPPRFCRTPPLVHRAALPVRVAGSGLEFHGPLVVEFVEFDCLPDGQGAKGPDVSGKVLSRGSLEGGTILRKLAEHLLDHLPKCREVRHAGVDVARRLVHLPAVDENERQGALAIQRVVAGPVESVEAQDYGTGQSQGPVHPGDLLFAGSAVCEEADRMGFQSEERELPAEVVQSAYHGGGQFF